MRLTNCPLRTAARSSPRTAAHAACRSAGAASIPRDRASSSALNAASAQRRLELSARRRHATKARLDPFRDAPDQARRHRLLVAAVRRQAARSATATASRAQRVLGFPPTTRGSRDRMVYAGANDGMLHGFDAETGAERLGFIPSAVFQRTCRAHQDQNYSHHYYVDGSPTMGDAFFNGDWHTVIAGGLNKGGQGIYALDVTDPSTFNARANAGHIVLWEFTDARRCRPGRRIWLPTASPRSSSCATASGPPCSATATTTQLPTAAPAPRATPCCTSSTSKTAR